MVGDEPKISDFTPDSRTTYLITFIFLACLPLDVVVVYLSLLKYRREDADDDTDVVVDS